MNENKKSENKQYRELRGQTVNKEMYGNKSAI